MQRRRALFCWLGLAFLAVPLTLHAQNESRIGETPKVVVKPVQLPGEAPVPRIQRGPHAGRPHQPPCWEEAGISKSAIDERRSIEQRTHAEVRSVCADSALTMEQKKQKIQEIHKQAHEQTEGLITPQQQEALKACQQARNGGGHHGGGGLHAGGGHGGGPCGEMASHEPEKEKEKESEE
jgi:hypothetical protein